MKREFKPANIDTFTYNSIRGCRTMIYEEGIAGHLYANGSTGMLTGVEPARRRERSVGLTC